MPKPHSRGLINLNLLKVSGEPQQIYTKFISWLLSAGRFIIVIVEAVVIIAFVSRFKLDSDIAATKEAIEDQIPFIESLKPDEILIRQTQFQIASMKDISKNSPDFSSLIKEVSAQVPQGATLTNLSFTKNKEELNLKITGSAQNDAQITTLVFGLRQDKNFSDISLDNVSLKQGLIQFSIQGKVNITKSGQKL